MADPPAEAVEKAVQEASRIARTCGMVAAGCGAVVVAAALLALVGVPQVALVIGGFGLIFGALYGTAWRRATAARAGLRSGMFRAVRAEGWCRPPDGCNYAIFTGTDADEPGAVVRLPLRREMKRFAHAWLAGDAEPSVLGGVGLFDSGGLLATGRVVSERTARKRWLRRGQIPGRHVQRPPEGWYPPGGE